MLDLVIVGGGPAGVAAAVYAARKRLKTALVLEEWGGQSNVSTDVQNWIGTKHLSGADLAKNLREHAEEYAGEFLEIKVGARATKLATFDDRVEIEAGKERLDAKAALLAPGASRRKLEVPGAKEYDQKGITYCASCDGPLFAEKDVVVIGGGNAGFETALELLEYCKSVTLLHKGDAFKADEITIAAAKARPNFSAILHAQTQEVVGEQFVTGLRYKDTVSGKESTLAVEGIFVEIGLVPNTEWIGDVLEKNKIGQIVVDPKTQRAFTRGGSGSDARRGESDGGGIGIPTMTPTQGPRNKADGPLPTRVWAAGDCTNGLYHQNNIAAGDAVKALEDVYMFLRRGGGDA